MQLCSVLRSGILLSLSALLLGSCAGPVRVSLIEPGTALLVARCAPCLYIVSVDVANTVQHRNIFQAGVGELKAEQELNSLFTPAYGLNSDAQRYILRMDTLEMSSPLAGFNMTAKGVFLFSLHRVEDFTPTWSRQIDCEGHAAFSDYSTDSVIRSRIAVERCINDGIQRLIFALEQEAYEG